MVGVYDVMKPVWWPPTMGCMVSESLRGVVSHLPHSGGVWCHQWSLHSAVAIYHMMGGVWYHGACVVWLLPTT